MLGAGVAVTQSMGAFGTSNDNSLAETFNTNAQTRGPASPSFWPDQGFWPDQATCRRQ